MTKRKATRHVLLPDIHHPYHDKEALASVIQFIKWFKPDEVVLLGDAMQMDAVSHWLEKQGKRRQQEGLNLRDEYDAFDKDILTPLEKICPNAKKVFMGGNHEDWAEQAVDKQPNLKGSIEPEICLNLEDRGWKWIPYILKDKGSGFIKGKHMIGKLQVFHGDNTTKYHAEKVANQRSTSVAYGHTHDYQVYTKVFEDNPRSYHTAQSVGCLSTRSPEFLKGKLNRWVTGFGVVYVRPGGAFNLYVPIIVRGKFSFANKEFGGA